MYKVLLKNKVTGSEIVQGFGEIWVAPWEVKSFSTDQEFEILFWKENYWVQR